MWDRIREETDTEHGIEEALHGQAFVRELWREEGLGRFGFRGIKVIDQIDAVSLAVNMMEFRKREVYAF